MHPDPSPAPPPGRRPPTVVAVGAVLVVGVIAVASLAIAGLSLLPASDGVSAAEARLSPAESAALVRAALDGTAPGLPTDMPTERPVALRKPLDAPSLEEFGYARALAHDAEAGSARRVDGSAGYEFLSLDVVKDASPGQRAFEIQSYDYTASQLVSQRVDLVRGTVSEQRASGSRPAPSAREGVFAMDLLLRSEESAEVRAKFAELTGEELTSPAQLDYVPTSSVPALALRSVPNCETNRCITFQGRSRDGVWLYLNRLVVDLTDMTVHTLT